ncbi:MAG: hypothetical protein SVM80_04325 [Halobacteriota archaeon]|nr:hypothetical protein [Halobacteriota archaeon]
MGLKSDKNSVAGEEKEIKNASTVALSRETENNLEIFMTKRKKDLPFLGGFHVFPGGEMDEEDHHPESLKRCIGLTPGEAKGILKDSDPHKSLGHFVAAIRELYEETGILLAYDASSKDYPDLGGDETKERFENNRNMINEGKMTMKEMMEEENLCYAVDELVYFYHRVAPKFAPVRFNARFFIVKIPDGQTPTPHENEIEGCEWLTPQEILAKSRKREILLAPPTMLSLRILAKFNTFEDLMEEFKGV